ncbi:hypothetical protein [Actinoplanes aureus]|uniref:Uncharacterized protein n=1 Tax=Actinoplanes aureus TaxID=2792083 RepID=A0A931CDM8_9ACTN|nr:hypothetical protein [Actinoplanes aureus]MBG0566704.1 hypothetical protein [Actinoplanes aureus]
MISEGGSLVSDTLRQRSLSRYAVEAAIAAVHAQAPTWRRRAEVLACGRTGRLHPG